MLEEITNVRQQEKEGFRRWFRSGFFDLIVWYDQERIITGFQLCYGKPDAERAIIWQVSKGYTHQKVDDGEISGGYKMTPILVKNGIFEKESIIRQFKTEAENLEHVLVNLIIEKLLNVPL